MPLRSQSFVTAVHAKIVNAIFSVHMFHIKLNMLLIVSPFQSYKNDVARGTIHIE